MKLMASYESNESESRFKLINMFELKIRVGFFLFLVLFNNALNQQGHFVTSQNLFRQVQNSPFPQVFSLHFLSFQLFCSLHSIRLPVQAYFTLMKWILHPLHYFNRDFLPIICIFYPQMKLKFSNCRKVKFGNIDGATVINVLYYFVARLSSYQLQ